MDDVDRYLAAQNRFSYAVYVPLKEKEKPLYLSDSHKFPHGKLREITAEIVFDSYIDEMNKNGIKHENQI